MKAAVLSNFKQISIEEIPKPEIQEDEVLIKIKYAGICGSDVHAFLGELPTAKIPVVLGHEFYGELVEIKPTAETDLKIGDNVVAQPFVSCNRCELCLQGKNNVCPELKIFGINEQGGFAEYIKVPINKVYSLPAGIDPKIGALIEPFAVAVHDVRRSRLKIGQTVFIIGGGPIGLLIALVVRLSGASKVVISEINKHRIKFAEELGFYAINPKEIDVEKEVLSLTEGKGFDIVFEVSGTKHGTDLMVKAAKIAGTIVLVGMPKEFCPIDIMKCDIKELNIKGCRIHPQNDFTAAVDIVRNGQINEQLQRFVTHIFPLEEVEKAFKFVLEDDKYIKVLLKVS